MSKRIGSLLFASAVAVTLPGAAQAVRGTVGYNDRVSFDTRHSAPIIYAPDFVSAAAYGVSINDAGDFVGASYADTGCGPFCLPPLETVVWRDGVRMVLPALPDLTGTAATDINNRGWISGTAGAFGFTHAAAWKPKRRGYIAIDLGVLPGTAHSAAVGIDDSNRVVGAATAASGFQTPFLWTKAGGMVDLAQQGFPNEIPLGISSGGTVATYGYWYHLGEPASVTAMAPAPPGGWFVVNAPIAINDAGDQARGLGIGNEHPFTFVHRYHHEGAGTWQQIDFTGTGPQSAGGIGSITGAQDITDTVSGTAQIAYGPDGLNQPVDNLFSTAYHSIVAAAGPMNKSGQILAQVTLGLSGRLMRLRPVTACMVDCIRVSALRFKAKFHEDPGDPDHCSPGNEKEFDLVHARATLTSETGAKLGGILVRARFMDQYWKNAIVSGTTNAKGIVEFELKGPCGVGTESFIVEDATGENRMFDKTMGVLTASAIPQ